MYKHLLHYIMKNIKSIDCVILFNDPFPIGQAATNRIISIAKGLNENGIRSTLLILRATEKSTGNFNPNAKGTYDGIDYEYLSKTTLKANTKLGKIKQMFFSRLKFCIRIFNLRKSTDVIIYPLDSLSLLILLRFLIFLSNIKVLRHVDEYPPYILIPEKYSSIYIRIYQLLFYRSVDAVLPMTKKLDDYYKAISPRTIPFLHLPMTVEVDRFTNNQEREKCFEYVTYCGNLGHNNKDGLPELIHAFSIVNIKYPKVKLKIIGSSRTEKDIIILKKLVQQLSLNESVLFTGSLSREEIPKHLCNSKVLVLSRPNNKQAEAGFPTKLGEYLATGKPVVATSVGEIPYYLTDRISAFIAKPSNYMDFGNKIIEVLDDYEFALKVGQAGREVALQHFDYRIQGKILSHFIKTIL